MIINNLESLIKHEQQILSEEVNKQELLAVCVYQRLKSNSDKYTDQIDQCIKKIQAQEISTRDILNNLRTIKVVSEILSASYRNLLKTISKFS